MQRARSHAESEYRAAGIFLGNEWAHSYALLSGMSDRESLSEYSMQSLSASW